MKIKKAQPLTPPVMRNYSVRLPESLWTTIAQYAAADGNRPSDFIRDTLLIAVGDRSTAAARSKKK